MINPFCSVTILASITYASTILADTIEVPGEYRTIQEAINASVNGDEIVVSTGTYTERIDYLGKLIRIRSSHGPDVTTIDGEGTGYYPVVTMVGNVTQSAGIEVAILEGFTITGGLNGGLSIHGSNFGVKHCYVTNNGDCPLGNQWGAIMASMCTLMVEDCSIDSNFSLEYGGGLYGEQIELFMNNCTISNNLTESDRGSGLHLEDSSATISNCLITANDNYWCYELGGGVHAVDSSLTLIGCVISDHHLNGFSCAGTTGAAGGGLFLNSCESQVEDCAFVDNTAAPFSLAFVQYEGGGAIYAVDGMLSIQDSVFFKNRASNLNKAVPSRGGAIRMRNVAGSLFRCAFDLNAAHDNDPQYPGDSGHGGAIWIDAESDISIVDCSFTRNETTGLEPSGGAIYGGSPTIFNSFFCSNDPDDIDAAWTDGGGNVFLEMCIEGDLDGDGDVDFDDFTQLLASWGDPACGGSSPCPADIDGDGDVDFDDFTTLLANWSS